VRHGALSEMTVRKTEAQASLISIIRYPYG
jgi:hypothetical protein